MIEWRLGRGIEERQKDWEEQRKVQRTTGRPMNLSKCKSTSRDQHTNLYKPSSGASSTRGTETVVVSSSIGSGSGLGFSVSSTNVLSSVSTTSLDFFFLVFFLVFLGFSGVGSGRRTGWKAQLAREARRNTWVDNCVYRAYAKPRIACGFQIHNTMKVYIERLCTTKGYDEIFVRYRSLWERCQLRPESLSYSAH